MFEKASSVDSFVASVSSLPVGHGLDFGSVPFLWAT